MAKAVHLAAHDECCRASTSCRFELDGRASKMRDKELKFRLMNELDEAGVLMRIDSSGRNLRKLKGVSDVSVDIGS